VPQAVGELCRFGADAVFPVGDYEPDDADELQRIITPISLLS
jgi:hypothetical protein